MKNNLDKYLEALEKIKIVEINDHDSFLTWKRKATNFIIRIYGENSTQESQINQINFSYGSRLIIDDNPLPQKHNGNKCREQIRELIESYIDELKMFGLPERKYRDEDSVRTVINNNNNLTQQMNVNIIFEILKDELTEKQLNELKEIVFSKEEVETKKHKIKAKLKSFGQGVLENVFSNILTNLSLFS